MRGVKRGLWYVIKRGNKREKLRRGRKDHGGEKNRWKRSEVEG